MGPCGQGRGWVSTSSMDPLVAGRVPVPSPVPPSPSGPTGVKRPPTPRTTLGEERGLAPGGGVEPAVGEALAPAAAGGDLSPTAAPPVMTILARAVLTFYVPSF